MYIPPLQLLPLSHLVRTYGAIPALPSLLHLQFWNYADVCSLSFMLLLLFSSFSSLAFLPHSINIFCLDNVRNLQNSKNSEERQGRLNSGCPGYCQKEIQEKGEQGVIRSAQERGREGGHDSKVRLRVLS